MVNLLCLIYKLNFIIGKILVLFNVTIFIVYRIWYYLQFQASTVGLGMYSPRISRITVVKGLRADYLASV